MYVRLAIAVRPPRGRAAGGALVAANQRDAWNAQALVLDGDNARLIGHAA